MRKTFKALVAMLLAVVTISGITIGSIGNTTPSDTPTVIIDTDGTVIEIPSPDANGGKPWLIGGGNTGDNSTGDDNGNTDGHVPGTPRDSKATTKNELRIITNSYASDGKLVTLVKSVSSPTKPDTKNTSNDTQYGKVDWSTAAQGYITFTAKGQVRGFILQGPNGNKSIFTVQKDETIKVSLIDGTGKYQYSIANDGGNGYLVQYKNTFEVKKIDSDLAPYLVSNPWGDYDNAPNAVAKADELWDTNKTQLQNIKAIAKWVGDLHYDKTLKAGPINIYVNPDKVIENGGGVCNDVSKLLIAMLRSQGVPAYYQSGTNARGTSHAWVMVWIETSNYTQNGTTYSTGAWVIIEAVGGSLQSANTNNYNPNEYAG